MIYGRVKDLGRLYQKDEEKSARNEESEHSAGNEQKNNHFLK